MLDAIIKTHLAEIDSGQLDARLDALIERCRELLRKRGDRREAFMSRAWLDSSTPQRHREAR